MRLFHCLSLAALLFIFLSGDSVLGAPTKGERLRECKDVDENGQCIEMSGNKIDSDGLYPYPQKMIASDKSSEESREQSGEGSGFDIATAEQEESNHIKEEIKEESVEEESSADNSFIDNEIMPWKQHSKLSDQELQMDNVIQ